MTLAGVTTEFPLPNAGSAPETIVVGPDGNMWFTELLGNRIGRITTSGIITEFPIPTPGSQPEGIAAGPDGNLWFSETLGNKIGRITTDGVITEFPLPGSGRRPEGLTAGPDGAVWFVSMQGNRVGRITAQGVITEFPLPTANAEPWNITLGADGNLWFSEGEANQIGRITPAGVITEFPIPTPGGTPDYITSGPDGNVWFSEFYGNRVGRITMAGEITEFVLPAPTSHPYGITTGPDGAMWFCLEDENSIARITVAPAFPNPMEVDARTVTGTSSNANGVFESGETVQIDPTWTNTLVTSSDLTGAASAFDGAGSATYTIDDGTADYGTVPAESSASCEDGTGDCHLFTITGTRPAPHWDASFTETVSPDDIEKSWTLHVGESFPDVPTSHPFYAFIENLFHSGVTGGCGLGNYCPGNSVTRGQMAVFLLKGKLGTGLTVPPATGTVFLDVPASHPFAAWIEALAGFKITGGCGNGNYCPENSVTRAQMAVFLLKSKHGSAYVPPPCTPGYFDDVACPSQFADWIQQLAEEAITGGCGGNNYCPTNPITRGQMAVFLVKTFGLNLYGP
jgi:streptogramin lyase